MPCWNLLGIEICLPSLDDIVNAVVSPITNFITSSLSGLIQNLSPLFSNVINTLSPLFQTVINSILAFLSNSLGSIQNTLGAISGGITNLGSTISVGLSNILSNISSGLSNLGHTVTDGLSSLGGSVSSGIANLGSSLSSLLYDTQINIQHGLNSAGTMLSGAIETSQTVLMTAFNGMGNAIGGAMGGLFSGFGSIDLGAAGTQALTVCNMVSISLESGLARHSPMSPSEAVLTVAELRESQRSSWYTAYIEALAIEGFSLGQVDGPMAGIFKAPDIAAGMALATSWYAAPYEIGYKPLIQRFYLSAYQPNIPPYQDLIEIYVREGYLESHWVELPAEMVQNFKELGYNEEWTKRLWGKHWVYPSPTQLYEMLHRTAGNFPEIGVTSKVLKDMLKLHDFEPMWRGPLEAISWNTWRIYDIRTGWEMDLVDDSGLVKRLIDTGYEPKDAELLALVQKMFVLLSEIDGLLTESDTDFISGWISEDQLKADYEATPYNPNIIEMRVSRAKLRQERTDKADLKAALINRYTKGDLTQPEFEQELSRLGIQQDRISVEVIKANATKLKTVKEDTTVTTKALTESTYSRSYRVGLISEDEYRSKLAALKYSAEDISLLVELNTPQRPAPEEIPTLTLGELKAAFRVGVLSENELGAELEARRYSSEDITVIIETEKAKIKPKTTEAS